MQENKRTAVTDEHLNAVSGGTAAEDERITRELVEAKCIEKEIVEALRRAKANIETTRHSFE